MKKIITFLIISLIPIFCYAKDITNDSKILINEKIFNNITDDNENSYVSIKKGQIITIDSEMDIYGIYIIYELKSVTGVLINETHEIKIGQNGYLHEYIDINKPIDNLTLTFDDDVKIGEIYVLSEGVLPEYVEIWNPPCIEADLLLFSTHSDDEQLFFAGLIPHYIDKGAAIQVVYFTNHFDNPKRLHEQLHGLYKVGIRNYPIIGFIPDAWSKTLNGAINNLKKAGYTEEDAIKFEVEMLRKFKPLVVVGHDELGEYSHGQHILNTHALKQAILLSNDKEYDVNSIDKYGLWEVPKTYLHLYKENGIVMNYDIPLKSFNGKTAYEISKEGYSMHLSQQYTWFTKWLTGVDKKGVGTIYTNASEIKKYSPCEFGLYKSNVGVDLNKNDMFENLTLYKEKTKKEFNVEKEPFKEEKTNKKTKYYLEYGFLISIIIIIFLLIKKCNLKLHF